MRIAMNHQCWVCCCRNHAGLMAVMSWFAASRAVSRVQPALDTGTKQPETFRKHSQFIWHWNAEAWTEQRRLQWQWSDDATTPANSSTHNYLPSQCHGRLPAAGPEGSCWSYTGWVLTLSDLGKCLGDKQKYARVHVSVIQMIGSIVCLSCGPVAGLMVQ